MTTRGAVPEHRAITPQHPDGKDDASGYMQMRWNQHSSHGRKPAISE
jgi:hypothetical protein